MNIEIGKTTLITTDNWFYAPDGMTYNAVFGTIKVISTAEDTLGIKTNSKSTNWYIEIGCMVIAGCQVHYAIRTNNCNFNKVISWDADATNGIKEYERPCAVFMADKDY